jgi:capsule polysaccharide export protein KpsE/RkpR
MRDWLKAVLNLGRIFKILLHRTADTRRAQKAIMDSLIALQAAIATLDAKVDAHNASDGPKDSEIATLRAELAGIDAALQAEVVKVAAIEAKLSV